jgi:PAS domain S-box-containing protein
MIANPDVQGKHLSILNIDTMAASLHDSASSSPPASAPDFQFLAESLPQIVWVGRADGVLEFVNSGGLAYAGIEPEQLAGGAPGAEMIHPLDRAQAQDVWDQAVATARGFSLEARLRRYDGAYRWHLVQAHPIRDALGKVTKWMGTATDVHDVRERSERNAFLLSLSTELSRIADPHDLLCTAMMRLGERLHATRATLAELDHEEDEAILLTQCAGDEARIEITRLPLSAFGPLAAESVRGLTTVVHDTRADGRSADWCAQAYRSYLVRAIVSVPLLRGGVLVALLAIVAAEPHRWSESEVLLIQRVADIVWPAFEKARADRALAEREERLRLAQAVARVGAWEWDPATDQCFLSPECHELFGLAPGGPHSLGELLALVDAQDLPAVRAALEVCRKDGMLEFDYRYRHPLRGTRWIHSKAGAVFHAGRPFVVGMHLDVTERKQAEAALQDINQRKDEFLAMLAHELRNPLAPIRNAAQILRLHAKGNSKLEWARAVIERQSRHLTRLVDDLLDVSRIVRGQITLETSSVELGDVLRHALETSRPLVRERGHELTVSLPETSLLVDADLTRLAQVFANLLINAAKYTSERGRIWLESESTGGMAIVRVRDNGIGISPSLLPHVFDLFTQGTRTLDRAQGGLGIGLTLVKRIVEMHGGTVEARSAGPGNGSEFTVRLPLLTRGSVAEADQAAVPAGRLERLRVLVVDDNVDAAESIAMLLSLEGHDVLTAHQAQRALEAVASFRPHVVLLDIGLPGMDGYEVARRLRSSRSCDGIRLVAVTGYGQQSDRERAREAGFDLHLVKPVEPEALQSVMADLPRGPTL